MFKEKNMGYDALTGDIVDMHSHGILDAVKVSRTALENAVSAASMFLSIEVAIIDKQDDETK